MATFQVLYWQEIPSQVKAVDDEEEISLPMPDAFMARIDAAAAQRGLQGTDDYLAQWHWSEEQQRPGPAQDVAEAVVRDLVARSKENNG